MIYAISVLWALARVSGAPLPMIIDTLLLARLDREHRALFRQKILPERKSSGNYPFHRDSEIDREFIPFLETQSRELMSWHST